MSKRTMRAFDEICLMPVDDDRRFLTSPAFRRGNAQNRTAFVLSAPGKAECKAQRPAAGQTGKTLEIALSEFHCTEPCIFPSTRLDDYTLVNAWGKMENEDLTRRTEATDAEILGPPNICRLALCLQDMEAIVALGDKAQLAVDKVWSAGTLLTGGHPSLKRLNQDYCSHGATKDERRKDRTLQWARRVLNSKQLR